MNSKCHKPVCYSHGKQYKMFKLRKCTILNAILVILKLMTATHLKKVGSALLVLVPKALL